ncbi:hypothetical protein GCM10008931_42580 [Oceanobacillus oncorhynchi subsp. oncorhynchi]|uniref:peptidoglycan-binding protein n=1 Tax=Oceanobacillus oncorhynchi TaxID=545501 RepID=UPI0031E26B8F
MANWTRDKVFNGADEFLRWLDKNFGSYISKHISENHVHHTWRPNHANNRTNSTLQLHKNMRNFHVGTNGWADIAQHITIGSDGRIVLGRNIMQMPVSATNYNGSTNWHPFAYEMIGNFDKGNDVLQGKQLESVIKVSRYFYSKKNKPVKFHRELLLNGRQPKSCPGTGISKTWFMNLVKDSKFDVGKSVNTGKISKSPDSSVKSAKAEPSSRNYLQRGDKGSAVKTMQQNLIKAGYSLPKYGADSSFGEESETAVKAMQKKNSLVVDGLYGQASSTALDKEIKGGGSSSPKKSGSTSTEASGSLKSKVNGLRFYNKPSWSDKDVAGKVNKGLGFPTIVKKMKVGNSYQYQVKNSKGATFYITASTKYVTVSGNSGKSSSNAKKTSSKKSIATLVKETKAGKHGNGDARKRSLGKDYQAVMDVINGKASASNKSKSSQSVSQMANKIINDSNAPTGHKARREWLGISKSQYEKVRKEVNKRV